MEKEFIQIEPSLIAADWGHLSQEAEACLKAGAKILHMDVMDGHFVKNFTMGPDIVAAIKRTVPELILDIHLMIYSPDDYIERFVAAGAEEITFHFEATEDIEYCIDYIRKSGKKVGLAINPETPAEVVLKYLSDVDKVLVMTVHPGFGGQKFMENMLDKVFFLREEASKEDLKLNIQVDGGINFETAGLCIQKGANRLVTGSHFFQQKSKEEAFKTYNNLKELWDFHI